MRKVWAILLACALCLGLVACGGSDPNAGKYDAVSCTALGISVECEGDWLELKGNGKGTLRLEGEDYSCKWQLDGENITLENKGDVFHGTLSNGIITMDFSGITYVYAMGSVEQKDGTVKGHTHQWQPADCVRGETCAECGATQGEPAGHDFAEANYQQAATCKVCGETSGEKLQADMEKYGFTEFMEIGVPYDYHTCCNKNPDVRTTSQVTVTKYEILEEAEGYPAKEGYEWRIVEMQALFSEQNAKSYGPATDTNYEDYYTIELHDDTVVVAEDNTVTYSVSYNGQIMDATEKMESEWSGWHWANRELRANIRTITWAFCVPKGYDGVVVGFRDASVEWLDDTYLYDYDPASFLLFRLN